MLSRFGLKDKISFFVTNNRIYNSLSTATNNAFNRIYKMIGLNINDLFSQAYQLAQADEFGSALLSIGPGGLFSKRYAIFVGAKDPQITAQQLQVITDIDQAGARKVFNPIGDFTESNFFLAFGREESKKFRQLFNQYANLGSAQSEFNQSSGLTDEENKPQHTGELSNSPKNE